MLRGLPIPSSSNRYYRKTGLYRHQGPELKVTDQAVDDSVIAAGCNIWLNASGEASALRIAEGVGEEERVGRKITITNILFRYNITIPASTNHLNTFDIVRVICYVDRQTNGAAAANTDILDSNDYRAFNNLSNSKRFIILLDKYYTIACASGSGNGTTDHFGGNIIADSFYKKCSLPIEYNAANTDGRISTIKSNNIGFMFCSRYGLAGIAGNLRLRFKDN